MTKRSVSLMAALLLLMFAALAGLPWMARRLSARWMDQPVYVTRAAEPMQDIE